MGCRVSKVEDLPLVTYCRERKQLIKSAADHRFALAAAHTAYFHQLRGVGDSLCRFVEEELTLSSSSSSSSSLSFSSPVGGRKNGNNKKKKKGKGNIVTSYSTSISHNLKEIEENSHLHLSSSSSLSDSESGHIDFEEEEEEDGDGDGDGDSSYRHEKVKQAPLPQPGISYFPYPFGPFNPPPVNSYANPYYPPPMDPYGYPPYQFSNDYPENNHNSYGSSTSYTTYYMKKTSTPIPTVIYEEPKQNPVYSCSDYPNYPSNGDYPNYHMPNGSAGYFGFMKNSEERRQSQQPPRPPPAPPSPNVSAWDFFNPFETFESGGYSQIGYEYGSNTSSPDSREVREREGIPDLEEETESEVFKEPYIEKRKNKTSQLDGRQENNNVNINFNNNNDDDDNFGEVREVKGNRSETEKSSIAVSMEELSLKKRGVRFEAGGVFPCDKESSKPSSLTTLSAQGTRDLREVAREIKDEFEAATDYGKEVSVLLEAGKKPHKSWSNFSKVCSVCSTSLSSVHCPSTLAGEYHGDDLSDSWSLASTLEKLYAWEKKLYKEVKDEERLRVMYEKQCKKLKNLDDQGAESSKVEVTRASIRKLLTKINVSIRAVDSISSRIHKLRDEELRPQLIELIYGLRRMWKLMLKCHQKQFQAILESKTRALKAKTGLRRDSSVRATYQLEVELLKWSDRFNNWIEMQRSYSETLNSWLEKCFHYEPEITPDGVIPFSPGRLGAPPVLVICHNWKQAMERISESEVQTTMNDFATSLRRLWERQDEEQRRRLKAENLYKDFEEQIRDVRMESQRRGHEHGEALSDKNSLSMVASRSSGISALDDLGLDLDSMRERVKEERAGHKESLKLVHDAVSRSIQAGLIPIFEALESFSSDASRAFDSVRLEHVEGGL